jgi:hypothetical protein
MLLLREYIRNILCEKRRQHSEDRYKEEENKLKSYVNKGLFFHMTHDYHLQGVNIKSSYKTPLGIYVYPLTQNKYEQFMNNELPFANDRKYIIVYKPRGKLLIVSQYTWEDYEKDAKKLGYDEILIDKNKKNEKIIKNNKLSNINNDPTLSIMFFIYDGDFSNSLKANRNLIKLGYAGIYDDVGKGIIHENEPEQAFFVNSKSCEIVDVIDTFVKDETLRFTPQNRQLINKLLLTYQFTSKENQEKINKKLLQLHVDLSHYDNVNLYDFFDMSEQTQVVFIIKNAKYELIHCMRNISEKSIKKLENSFYLAKHIIEERFNNLQKIKTLNI